MRYEIVQLLSDDWKIGGLIEYAPSWMNGCADSYIVRIYKRNATGDGWDDFSTKVFGTLSRAEDYLIEKTESSLWTLLKGPD